MVKGVRGNSTQENMQYCDLFNHVIRCGQPFNETWIPVLERLNLTDKQVAQMTAEDDTRILSKYPTFVTAFSDNHYGEAMAFCIPQIRRMTGSNYTPIVIFDLGLKSSNLKQLRAFPTIEVRKFNFSAYPEYVRDLYQFRWKALLIAEMLLEHDAVFYADAHFYWKNLMPFDKLLKKIRCTSRILSSQECYYSRAMFLSGAFHSIYSATDQRMYDFLPIDLDAAKRTEMGHAAVQLIYNTKDVRANVMKWFVLCALEEECMAPKGTVLPCDFPQGDRWTSYGNCHRQDQSAMSILVANRNHYVIDRFKLMLAHSAYF